MSFRWLPNTLTLLRCGLAFVVGWQILQLAGAPTSTYWPFVLFVGVAATDFVDGFAARALNAVSPFGAFLDPIADKLLVAIALLALCHITSWPWWLVLPTAVIVARDIYVTLIRLRPSVSLPVTRLAKWKTAAEMMGIGGYLLTYGVDIAGLRLLSLVLIGLAAAMSAYTGWLYVRAAR